MDVNVLPLTISIHNTISLVCVGCRSVRLWRFFFVTRLHMAQCDPFIILVSDIVVTFITDECVS